MTVQKSDGEWFAAFVLPSRVVGTATVNRSTNSR